MSEVNLSSATRAILEAAKRDGASAAVRAKVWGGVSGTVATTAATTGAASAAAASGAMGAGKMLVLGTLLGGSLSVGLAATAVYMGPARGDAAGATAAHSAAGQAGVAGGARDHEGAATTAMATTATATATAIVFKSTTTPARRGMGSPVARPGASDALGREASLVAGARSSLATGDARAALQAIHDARGLSSRQLGPEELAVEAQALRALGRDAEATEVDTVLKAQYPESALAR
jgi:hypothetical protein